MTRDEVYASRHGMRPSEVSVSSGSKFIGATFLYLALALVITFSVVGLMGALFSFALNKGDEASAGTFVTIFFVALLLYIPTLIWVRVAALRNGRTVGPAFFLYSIVMGALIAPLCVIFDFWTIVIALGTTCLAFGAMALIAWTSKRNLSTLGIIGSGLLLGAFMLAIFNWIISLFTGFVGLNWLVSFLFFIAIILITIFDLNNVRRIAESGGAAKNVAMLCALNLYVDFIYIFIRLLIIIASLRHR